jgi:hypothetical protein
LHEELWQRLLTLDKCETAQRAKCRYQSNPQRYIISLLNTEYTVNLEDRQIFITPEPQTQANFLEQLCILAYLINSRDLPLAEKIVKGESLPGGQFFFRGHHQLPTEKLQEVFGQKPQLLYKAAEKLNAERYDFGDAAVKLFVLPRIPVYFVVWAGNEEFEARASILFDQTAAKQLLLDALLVAVNLAVNALIKGIKKHLV